MKIIFTLLCLLIIAPFTWASPSEFSCKPKQWYSGGFDIFYLSEVNSSNGSKVYRGTRFWQSTSGHGILIGKPKVTGEFVLQASIVDDNVHLIGLSNSFLEVDGVGLRPLIIPKSWDTGSAQVESELFYNDIIYISGFCVAGKDSSIN